MRYYRLWDVDGVVVMNIGKYVGNGLYEESAESKLLRRMVEEECKRNSVLSDACDAFARGEPVMLRSSFDGEGGVKHEIVRDYLLLATDDPTPSVS